MKLELVGLVRKVEKKRTANQDEVNSEAKANAANWCDAIEKSVAEALLQARCMIDELPARSETVSVLERPKLMGQLERRLKLFVHTLQSVVTSKSFEQ